jgi:hypothetical protein
LEILARIIIAISGERGLEGFQDFRNCFTQVVGLERGWNDPRGTMHIFNAESLKSDDCHEQT